MNVAVKATPKNAGFVDRGFNHAKRKKRMEEEEKEIARLEAEARGEEYVEESEPSSKNTENTKVQTTIDTQQEEQEPQKGETQEDDTNLDAEEKSFKKRYGDLRRHSQKQLQEHVWFLRLCLEPLI